MNKLTVFTIVLIALTGVLRVESAEEKPDRAGNALMIDLYQNISGSFKRSERPSVLFPHDLHTDALKNGAEKSDTCTLCHLRDDGALMDSYMRLEEKNGKFLTELYHQNCLQCHKDMNKKRQKTGPVECGHCHRKKRIESSPFAKPAFNKSLHYRHEKANDGKCETCHHRYDEQKKSLIYEKGQESSCRYCHKEVREKNAGPLRSSSHRMCIRCHLNVSGQSGKDAPYTCRGCHEEKNRATAEKTAPVPRMKRNQPDFVAVEKSPTPLKNRMGYVPFDHMNHEAVCDSCRICHHSSFDKCSECHAVEKPEKGGGVSLEQAMHSRDSTSSCVGCHAVRQKKKECAGCHLYQAKTGEAGDAYCRNCHAMDSFEKGPEGKAAMESVMQSRGMKKEGYDEKQIPEKVIIDSLSDTYAEAVMPHRKIIQTLEANVGQDKLAAAFHGDRFTICRGCHHETPGTSHPSKCSHCHGVRGIKRQDDKPGLVAAYHIQCMNCHAAMEIEKNDCQDCHRKKIPAN